MTSKLLFLCSDVSVFDIPTKYLLKDKYRVYSSDECKDAKDEGRAPVG